MPIARRLVGTLESVRVPWCVRGVALLLVALLLSTTGAYAQTPSSSEPVAETVGGETSISVERIKAKIDEIEARKDIEPAVRDQALALYRKALAQIEAAEGNRKAAVRFQDAIKNAPARAAEIRAKLTELRSGGEAQLNEVTETIAWATSDEVEQTLDATQGKVAELKTELANHQTTLGETTSRLTEARAEQSVEKKRLDELIERRATGDFDESLPLDSARLASIAAERLARSAKINLLEQELISLPARQSLATARRDLVLERIDFLEKQIPILEARANELRKSDAIRQQVEAETVTRQMSGQHPVLQAYAKDTSDLRQKQTEVARSIEVSQSSLTQINADVGRVKDSLAAAQQIAEIGSVGAELGEYLRKVRTQLPVASALERSIRRRDATVVDARLQRLILDRDRRALSDLEQAAEQLLLDSGVESESERKSVGSMLEPLLTARRDALDRLGKAYALKIEQFAKLNAAENELLSQMEQLNSLLNNQLLWLPTSAPLGATWVEQIGTSLGWLSSFDSWWVTAGELAEGATEVPLASLLILALCGLIWAGRGVLTQRLDEIAGAIGNVSKDNLLLTPTAILISALTVLPLPLIVGYAGWLLTRQAGNFEFAASVGHGLLAGAALLLFLTFLQNLCRPNGLLRVHFKWSEYECNALARNLFRFSLVALPAAFLMGMTEASNSQVYRDGLGRIAFLVAAIASAALAFRLLSPRKKLVRARLSRDSMLWLTRPLWYALACAMPLALAVLALNGYYDAATQLLLRFALSVAIVLLGVLAYATAMREVMVTRRRLEMARARERREKKRAAAAAHDDSALEAEAARPVVESEELDVATISEQTRALLRMLTLVGIATALWITWQELLPALGILDRVSLWNQTITTDAGSKIVPVTLFNILIAVAVGLITFIAARNLPGMLEMTVLQRLNIEAGSRYAITTVSRYAIIMIGVIIAFNRIGADWSQVQWIVAALGVGVGFGLQEIVANFISGLIILFERPVRVGDIVTIGNLTGTVSRIQIRATSITDWDNREILVPNKSLITDNVVNWTLTEPVTRLLFKVGIAYGSDTDRAQKVISEAVEANPLALRTPPPRVLFLGFGDSSLDFQVFVFVAQPAHRLRVLHELHTAINRALNEAGIEIPFPQRDLHLKLDETTSALKDRKADGVRKDRKEAAE